MTRAKLLGVGDVGVRRADPTSMFTHVRETLAQGDLVIGQLETTITDRGARSKHAKLAMRAPPDTAPIIAAAGFDIMSAAGNHCLDWGVTGLADTLSHMSGAGVRLVGIGANIAEARTAAFTSCGDARVAVLSYSSILPENYWAETRRPGCAPMRAHTRYDMIEPDQPGTPPRIHTSAHADDLAALTNDILSAKRTADIVIVCMHWGIHMTPGIIADYQREVAHAAIDAGAGLILGHHAHILKGVEFYRDTAIFYSLGNFAIEQPQAFDAAILSSASFKHLISLHPGVAPEGIYVLPDDTRKTMIVEATIEDRRIIDVAILPCWIDDRSTPHVLAADSARFHAVGQYVADMSAQAGFATRFTPDGARFRLTSH